jgi:YebC/PmpR family DNA-binding regulatory protein
VAIPVAGHSKWANRVHRKTRQDAKRARLFSKLSRGLTVVAREGGGDPDMNPRLRTLIDTARQAEMPADKIDYAIKRGLGEVEGEQFEAARYEGYAPGGVALLVECLTDNNQRTVAEVRNLLKERGGKLGGAGSVTWMFEQKGVITVPRSEVDEETVFLAAAEAGAEDVLDDDDEYFEVRADIRDFHAVLAALREQGIHTERAELTMIPSNSVAVPDDEAPRLLALLDSLQEHDDVQQVFANFEISDRALAAYDGNGGE